MRTKQRTVGVVALLAGMACAVLAPSSVLAQQPVEAIPAPRFDINRFEVIGNTLLPEPDVERVVAPFTGAGKDFSDIQRALEALEAVYRDRGWGVVQVILPEQDITRGVVRFWVVQPRVGRVVIEGNTHFSTPNIRRSLPAIKEGETPNSKKIARNLQLTAEHPVKQTTVLLRSGASDEKVDVSVKVADDKPWRVFATLDNSGTGETGYWRAGFGLQHTNLFDRDHVATGHYVTSPTRPSDVTIAGLGYRIPFYGLNSSLDLTLGYSDVNSGTIQDVFTVSGSGTIGGVRWNTMLPRWGEVEQKVAFGLDYRAFKNEVLFAGQNQIPDITIHPVSVTYSGLWRMTAAELSFYAGVSRNIPGGNDGSSEDFQCPRPSDGLCVRTGADANYSLARYGFSYTRQFRNEWQMRVAFNGQYADDALVSGEQYGIGGSDTVRGYMARETANDRGYSSQLELYTPDQARRVGLSDQYRLRFLGFYDSGTVSRNNAGPQEARKDSIASAGVGLRLGVGKSLSVRLDLAHVLQATANRTENRQRLSGTLALVY